MTVQDSKVKSFVVLGNIPFTETDKLVNVSTSGTTKFIMNIRIKYEIGRVELAFNNQLPSFQFIQGSTPGIIDLDIGSLNLLIHLIKFGTDSSESNLTFTSGPNGLASQVWGSYSSMGTDNKFKIGEETFIVKGPAQESLLLTQLEIALDMLTKGSIEYSVKKDHIAGRMQGGSTPPAALNTPAIPGVTTTNGTPGSTPPAMPGSTTENNMNTAPESVTIQRPNFGPDLNKAPGNPSEVMPGIPGRPPMPG